MASAHLRSTMTARRSPAWRARSSPCVADRVSFSLEGRWRRRSIDLDATGGAATGATVAEYRARPA
jgi:hypothetical protein